MQPLYWRYLLFAKAFTGLIVADCNGGYPLINKVIHNPQVDQFSYSRDNLCSADNNQTFPNNHNIGWDGINSNKKWTLDPEKSNVPYFYGQSTIVGMETADNGLYTCSGSHQSSSKKDVKNASRAYDPGSGSAGYRRSSSGNRETNASLNEPLTVNQTSFNSTVEDKSADIYCMYLTVIHDPQVDQFSYSRDNSLCSAIIGTETADNGLYTCNESNQSSSEKDIKNASRAYDPGGGSAGYRRSSSGNRETNASLNEPPTVNQTNFNSTVEDKSADVYCVYLTVIVLFVLRSCLVPIVGLALAWQSSCRSSHKNEEISKNPLELSEVAETNGFVIKREKGQSYPVLLNNSLGSTEKAGQDYHSHLRKEYDLMGESTHHTEVVLGNSTVVNNNRTTTLLSSGLALEK